MRTCRLLFAGLCPLLILAVASGGHAQVRLADIEAGVHYGFQFDEGEADRDRLGVQLSVPFWGPLEFSGALSLFVGWPEADNLSGSAWQGFANLVGRPFGRGSFLRVGYGLSVLHLSIESAGTDFQTSRTETADAALLGAELPVGSIRPFAEVYFVNLLDRKDRSVAGIALIGVNLKLE